jgi:hypothetical protein
MQKAVAMTLAYLKKRRRHFIWFPKVLLETIFEPPLLLKAEHVSIFKCFKLTLQSHCHTFRHAIFLA